MKLPNKSVLFVFVSFFCGISCWASARVDEDVSYDDVALVFGYGSLIWKPPCGADDIVECFPAKIRGFCRRFWQSSVDHRGTPEHPGYVVVLLRGDHPDAAMGEECECFGVCYRIRHLADILNDLDIREKNGYTRTCVEVFTADVRGTPLGRAIVYYSEEGNNPAYTGPVDTRVIAQRIATAVGPSGSNLEYLQNLHSWMGEMAVRDGHIEEIYQHTKHWT